MTDEEIREYVAEEERKHVQDEILRRLQRAHIPPRFHGKGFDEYHTTTPAQEQVCALAREYSEGFDRHRSVGRCLVFMGGVGTGKTHLCCSILQCLANHEFPARPGYCISVGYHVLYSSASELIRKLRATWRNDSRITEEQAIGELTTPHLLAIDEVGVGFGTEGERAQLSELIDARYRLSKPTLVITNLGREGLAEYIGGRSVDRLKDKGGIVALFNWDSYRK
jgi:DNA replication protein DnaC